MPLTPPLPPGVPPLQRVANAIAPLQQALQTATILQADSIAVSGIFRKQGPRWGIFKGTKTIAEAHSVLTFEFKQDSHVSQYPQEQGAFQSYNKVATPYDARVQMTRGGTEEERAAFLAAIEAAAKSLDLYDVVTPERVYSSANIQRVDYRRTARSGVGLITVEFWIIEIRATASAKFANVKTDAAADPKPGGTFQAYKETAEKKAHEQLRKFLGISTPSMSDTAVQLQKYLGMGGK